MLRKLTQTITLLVLTLSFQIANAQQWIGRTTGNYTGTYGLYNNASSISDSKYKYYFNFWGRGLNFYNNAMIYNAPIKLNQWANNSYSSDFQTLDGNVDFKKDWLLEDINGKSKYFSFNQDIWGPAFLFPISKKWNMSINTRQRNGLQIFGLTQDMARLAYNGIDSNTSVSQSQKFGVNVQSFQELSFTLGGILAQNTNHKLNGGATVKFLRGLGAAYLKGNSFNLAGVNSNSAKINGDLEYGYSDQSSVIKPFNNPYGLFSLNSRGFGAGFDLGINYQYTANPLKYSKGACKANDKRSDYDIKLAFAINDIGGIRYNRNSQVYNYSSGLNTNVNVSNNILDPFKNSNQNAFDTIGAKVFGQMGATKSYGFNTSLPTAINFQADFRMTKNFFLGLFLNQNLKGTNSTGLRSTSMLSLVPRIESRGFEFSMPLTLSENYRNFYIGAYTRIGPVFFGSDNLGGLLSVASKGQFTGADIYGGVSFGIGHCIKNVYENKVDPVYIDSVQNDTTYLVERDTMRLNERDTIIQRDTVQVIQKDTVYINKTINNKYILEKEAEIKKRETELNKRKLQLDTKEAEIIRREKNTNYNNEDLQKCKDQYLILENENRKLNETINKYNVDIDALNKKIIDLERQIVILKKPSEKQTSIEVVNKQKQIDSLNIIVLDLRTELERCRKTSNLNNNELLKKAEKDRIDAETRAKAATKKSDSLQNALNQKVYELDICKKTGAKNSSEIINRLELEKAKAEKESIAARKRSDSLNLILIQRTNELIICKKGNVSFDPDVLTRLENNVKAHKKSIDSLNIVVQQKNKEIENCKKTSVSPNNDVLKQLEKEKEKAIADANKSKKQIDSLNLIIIQKNKELAECNKGNNQNDNDAQLKKCEETNTLLKSEINEMSKTIGRLNTQNYALSNQVDSLITELKNCCSKCTGTGDTKALEDLLGKCKANNAELNAEISRLKTSISAKDKTLDSFRTVVSIHNTEKTTLNTKIVQLESEIAKLKSSGSNCDELQKQLDTKNTELKKVNDENTVLQNKIKTLTSQMNEYKTEYTFMVKQNQKCNAQLDSCKRGLYQTEPKEEDGNKGFNELEEEDSYSMNDTGSDEDNGIVKVSEDTDEESTVETQVEERPMVGLKIIGAILEAALESNRSKKTSSSSGSSTSSGSTSSGSSSKSKTETSSDTSNRPTETSSGTGSNNGTSGSSGNMNNSDRSGSGSSESTRRR